MAIRLRVTRREKWVLKLLWQQTIHNACDPLFLTHSVTANRTHLCCSIHLQLKMPQGTVSKYTKWRIKQDLKWSLWAGLILLIWEVIFGSWPNSNALSPVLVWHGFAVRMPELSHIRSKVRCYLSRTKNILKNTHTETTAGLGLTICYHTQKYECSIAAILQLSLVTSGCAPLSFVLEKEKNFNSA